MAVVSCPKCPTKLKVPDGVSGNTKCPKCETVFPVIKPAAPAFEVVDDPPQQAPGSRPAGTTAPPAHSKAADDPGFEVVDAKPKKRAVAEEDYDYDDDDRPRKKRRRADDDDEDDDEPKARKNKRRADDDDDDDDDRPQKKPKKKRRADDEDWQPSSEKRKAFAQAKTGTLLLSISLWLYLGALGVLTLLTLINWMGARLSADLMVLPGLIGLGNWIVALVGLGFCIAGLKHTQGLAIGAVSVAGVHLLLTFLAAGEHGGGFGRMSASHGGAGGMDWATLVTALPSVDSFLAELLYNSSAIGSYVLPFLAGLCEAARNVLVMLVLAGSASAAGDEHAAESARKGMLINLLAVGAAAIGMVIAAVLMHEVSFSSYRTLIHLIFAVTVILYLTHALSVIVPALAAMAVKDAVADRA